MIIIIYLLAQRKRKRKRGHDLNKVASIIINNTQTKKYDTWEQG